MNISLFFLAQVSSLVQSRQYEAKIFTNKHTHLTRTIYHVQIVWVDTLEGWYNISLETYWKFDPKTDGTNQITYWVGNTKEIKHSPV